MTIDLDELERLEKAATPGPWATVFNATSTYVVPDGGHMGNAVASLIVPVWAAIDEYDRHGTRAEVRATTKLIATMRNALPALIAAAREVERLRVELDTLRSNTNGIRHGEKTALQLMAMERDRAEAAEARVKELEAENGRLREANPDDIRANGWAVGIHNDYKLTGEDHTFWLATKGDFQAKGEGRTDAEALNEVRREIARIEALSLTAETRVKKLEAALTRAERKLSAYVGVCSGDKELTETVLPMCHEALGIERCKVCGGSGGSGVQSPNGMDWVDCDVCRGWGYIDLSPEPQMYARPEEVTWPRVAEVIEEQLGLMDRSRQKEEPENG